MKKIRDSKVLLHLRALFLSAIFAKVQFGHLIFTKTIKWGGLTEEQALSLITINPARQLGIDGQTGSIEVGKDADLVIFDRHPLDNFSVPQKTFVDGKLYFDVEGDRERQAAIRAEKEALTGKRRITSQQGAGS